MRVGALREQRRLVIRLERRLDRFRLVGEVEHHRLGLGRMSSIEPREGLHRVHPAELLVDVHRVQERLIKAGLELVGDDQESVFRPLEGLGRLRLRKTVHVRFGVGPPPVVDGPGESHQRLERIAVLGDVPVDRQPVPNGVQARAGDDHRLGPAANRLLRLGREVLDADPRLLGDRVRVQFDEGLEQARAALPLS